MDYNSYDSYDEPFAAYIGSGTRPFSGGSAPLMGLVPPAPPAKHTSWFAVMLALPYVVISSGALPLLALAVFNRRIEETLTLSFVEIWMWVLIYLIMMTVD